MNNYYLIDEANYELQELKPIGRFKHKDIQTLMDNAAISFSMNDVFDIGSVCFRMYMKPITVDIDIHEPLWMRYPKCPLCGKYVIKPPMKVKVPRGTSRIHEYMCWNNALDVIIWDKREMPCKKCVKDLAKYLYFC